VACDVRSTPRCVERDRLRPQCHSWDVITCLSLIWLGTNAEGYAAGRDTGGLARDGGWAQPPEARPTNRGRGKARPAAGGCRRGRSAAHKMASTSVNNWITSWSRRHRAISDASLLTAVGATSVCVIATTCFVHWPIKR
jgi:hypothetical protein